MFGNLFDIDEGQYQPAIPPRIHNNTLFDNLFNNIDNTLFGNMFDIDEGQYQPAIPPRFSTQQVEPSGYKEGDIISITTFVQNSNDGEMTETEQVQFEPGIPEDHEWVKGLLLNNNTPSKLKLARR